jgi:hypothetical protein
MNIKFTLYLLAIISIFATRTFAQDDTRIASAAATWQVQKYDITATLPASETDRTVSVKAALTVKNVSSSPAQALTLRIGSIADVSAVTVNGSTRDFTKREEKLDAARSLQRIASRIPAVAPGATASVTVDYKLTVKDNSGVAAVSLIGSQFLPQSFWYPTPNSWFFTRGADHAPFKIQVNAPGGLTAVSSGTQSGSSFDQKLNGQPFFFAGNWDVSDSGGTSVFMPKGLGPDAKSRATEIAAFVSEAKAYIANLLGQAPDVPIRVVASRRGAGFADSGLVVVDEGVFRRSKLDSLTAMNLAEAVAKLWLGSSVAINGEGQGAIREGLPRFIATEFVASKYGADVADVERARHRSAYAAIVQREEPLATVSPASDYYFAEVGNKGAMVWRLLDKSLGRDAFFEALRSNMKDGETDLAELRMAFSAQKELLDYMFDQVTDLNLLVGIPQQGSGESKVALRNTGGIDATVNLRAVTSTGENLTAQTTVRSKSFGEVTFKSPAKISRVEIDAEKYYPQTEYSDDIAPKEFAEGDRLLAVKRLFDKQDFAGTETAARTVLRDMPRFDDVRVLLGRALLALGRAADAEKEFAAVLNEKLPTSRSLAWANVGLGEAAAKAGQNAQAAKFADAAIAADADYGASLAARMLRKRLNIAGNVPDDIKGYFARFDKAAVSNRKAEVDALVVPGEVSKFAGGVSGSTEQWQTQVLYTDRLDANAVLVETTVSVKLLNRDPESGTAVFRLTKVGDAWKLSGVDMFEVR